MITRISMFVFVMAFGLAVVAGRPGTAAAADPAGASTRPDRPRWTFDLETGVATSGYNTVEIPRGTGTRFSLSRELSADPGAFVRLRAAWAAADRHRLSVLLAPLRLDAAGTVDRPLRFEGVEFPAGVPLTGRFRFDSYRLSYSYDLHRGRALDFALGLTAKIRSAEISLQSADLRARKTNTGFVLLVNFRLRIWPDADTQLILEGDAAAAPQGRAEDVLAAVQRRVAPGLSIKAGYRLLEGGADVDEVYNFAWINYFTLGATLSL